MKRWDVQIWFASTILTLLACQAAVIAGGDVAGHVAEGNKAYRNKRYDEALERYWSAEVRAPNSPIVHFNIGDALYKQGKYDAAMQAWRKALAATRDRRFQSEILSNMGTAALRSGLRDEAVRLLAEALQRNPRNVRARYNLLQAQLQPPHQQRTLSGDEPKDDRRSDGSDTHQKESSRQKPDEDQRQHGSSPDQSSMSEQDVQRLLELHEQQQQNLQRRQAKPVVPVIPESDRDW